MFLGKKVESRINKILIFLNVQLSYFSFQLHLKMLSSDPSLLEEMTKLSSQVEENWIYLQSLFNQSMCVLNYIKSALL